MNTEPNTDMTTGRSRRFLPTGNMPQVSDRAASAYTEGAIEMARFWMRFPEAADSASQTCLRRELLTISRALVYLAKRGVPS